MVGEASFVLIPMRFLSMLGHFLVCLIFFYSRRDNITVGLGFEYSSSEYDNADKSAIAACVLIFACFFIEGAGFLGGFSTFRVGMMLMHIFCHVVGGLLTS